MSEKDLDFFLDEPELYKRHNNALPKEEMYRFFPPQQEIISIDESDPSNNYRYIFNGQPKTEYEKKKLSKFYKYELKTGKINYPSGWLESDTMRLLQASEYDIKKAYSTINENIQWLNSIPKTINIKIITLLNSGFMYVHGRDHHFRPIIIVSIKIIKKLLSEDYSFDDINQSIIYLMNYIIKYLLIPGQIENWIVFVDFDEFGISDISEFTNVLSTLSKHRGRVFKNYFVNIDGFIKFSVKAATSMFNSVSRKLVILGSDELIKVQEIISPDNLERKYGGMAPDLIPGGNNLFPPIMPSDNFAISGENLNIISPEEYKNICLNSNPHKPFVICPKYEEIWKKEKIELEKEEQRLKENNLRKSIIINENEKKNKEKKNIDEKYKINENRINNNQLNEINRNSIKTKKKEIVEFLSKFHGYRMVNIYEERKFSVPSPINIKEINLFFSTVKGNKKYKKKLKI